MKKWTAIITLLFLTTCLASHAMALVIDNGGYDAASGYAILSDFSQRYGQVAGDDINFSSQSRLTGLEFWGLYYNYAGDFGDTPPTTDNFTLRFHDIVGGDPVENFFLEVHLGAPDVRINTGDQFQSYPLHIYNYSYDNLSIDLSPGTYLVSIINETTNSAVDGYWHWISSDNFSGSSYWRRENAHDFFTPGDGNYETYNWTEDDSYNWSMKLTVDPVPEPATLLLLGTGLIGIAAVRRRKK